MKKIKYVIGGIVVILIVIVTLGYIRINKMYPPSKLVETDMGKSLEYQDGVMIKVEDAVYLTDEQRDEIYKRIGEEPLCDLKILEVTLTLENISEECKKVNMTDLYVEGVGAANGISNFLVGSLDGEYSGLSQELQPGESRQVTYSYQILSNQFSKKLWNKIEKQKFWLTYSSYPVKTKLNLNIR